MLPRLVLLDRDDTINVDTGYVCRIEDFVLLPGVVTALQRLAQAGVQLAIATNQSGIARGRYTVADFERLMQTVRTEFAAQDIPIARIYHCPHHIDGIVPEFAVACGCRKPAPGMILQALRDFAIAPAEAVMIGDQPTDAQAAHAAGVTSYWLNGSETVAPHQFADGTTTWQAQSLAAAVEHILHGADR